MPSDVPEEPLHGETPEQHVLRLARDKAAEIARRLGDSDERWVVAADTLVISNGELLGKPVVCLILGVGGKNWIDTKCWFAEWCSKWRNKTFRSTKKSQNLEI